LEKEKRKKIKTGTSLSEQTDTNNSNQCKNQYSKEIIEEDLLIELIKEYIGKNGRILRGGWAKITAKYNLRMKSDFNQTQLRNYYVLKVRDKILNREESIKTPEIKKSQNLPNVKPIETQNEKIDENFGDQNNNTITKENKNNQTKHNPQKQNIPTYNEHTLNTLINILSTMRIEEMINWEHTPKISSLTIKRNILQTIDEQIDLLIQRDGIKDITDIIKLLYASQLCYKKLTLENKPQSNWINNINAKIDARVKEKELLNKYITNAKLNDDEKKTFTRILNKRKTIFSDSYNKVKKDEVNKILFDVENEISLYKKRLEVHFKRREYLRSNFQFECSRKNFYRNMETHTEEQTLTVDTEKLLKYWMSQFCIPKHLDKQKLNELLNKTILPMPTQIKMHISYEQIDNIINNLSPWKAAGIDKIYNFLYKI
ncbi:hypothetical protein DMUE_4746, partial [Dictyocoela muelleri]